MARAAAVPHPAVADAADVATGDRHRAGSPDDFIAEGEGPVVAEGAVYEVAPFSAIVLVSET